MTYDLESSFPTLRKAPITEAVIDIQAELPPDVDVARLRDFHKGLEREFPEIEDRVAVTATVRLEGSSSPEMRSEGPTVDGIAMRSSTDSMLVQARMDGFSLHKLSPYSDWKSIATRTRDLWRRYVEIARPIRVHRVAVRYINRVEVPLGVDFKETIRTVPEVAPGIPQGLPEYFMRLVIPHPLGMTAIVTEASLPFGVSCPAMLFDIDVFRLTDIAADNPALWSMMEDLRAYKNVIFFNSITPAQLEKYA